MAIVPLVNEQERILENECVGENLYIMRLSSPVIAASITAGQFIHMRISCMEGHILRRPFSVYDASPQRGTLDIMYQTVGCNSSRMAELKIGEHVESIGAIGNGWHIPTECSHALLIGGGVGAAPLFMHARNLLEAGVETDVVLGARTAGALAAYDRYAELLGHDPLVATDDGSLGHHGFCTDPARELLDAHAYDHVACCGPEPLMRIIAAMAHEAHASCQVSLERRMACGVGACLSCVVDTPTGKRRACVDGPVFDAEEVIW